MHAHANSISAEWSMTRISKANSFHQAKHGHSLAHKVMTGVLITHLLCLLRKDNMCLQALKQSVDNGYLPEHQSLSGNRHM